MAHIGRPTLHKRAGERRWQRDLRLYSGLVLFAFLLTHLLNHAVGLVSIEWMEAVRAVRVAVWRSAPVTALLAGALAVHIALSLYKFVQRRTWRVSAWEAVQLTFGLAIPLLLFRHILGTRLPHELYGVDDNYTYALWVMWPAEALNQMILIALAWVHGCIGLHLWLRLESWYGRALWVVNGGAVVVPILAFAGFAAAGRAARHETTFANPFNGEQIAFIYAIMDRVLWACIAVLAAAVGLRLALMAAARWRPTVRITYSDERVVSNAVGPTLLEISRLHGVPHASVCGGKARCSTCRVRVTDGLDTLAEPEEIERRVLDRVGASPNVRLACQLVPSADLTVATLLPARRVAPDDVARQDQYLWGVEQTVAILFADIRGFTNLSESRLPYDVVFILNQYLGRMSEAIADAGGYVDKFIGDGIMAIFGIERGAQAGAADALRAARAMAGVLEALNRGLEADLAKPIDIGIGIHTGPAILGRIGVSNARGATQRITALGDAVNTASRLEQACKTLRCQLVVSQGTLDAARFEPVGARRARIAVKGRSEKVQVAAFKRALDLVLPEAVAAPKTPDQTP